MLCRLLGFGTLATVWLSGTVLYGESVGPERVVSRNAVRRLAESSFFFVENQGQTDATVAFYAPTFAGITFVTKKGQIVHSLRARRGRLPMRWTATETFVGGSPRPIGHEVADARASYFVGSDRSRWRSTVATYVSLSLGQVWPGVEVILRGRRNSVEKLFVLSPGVLPDRIRVRLSGTGSPRIDEKGQLVASTRLGSIVWSAPVAYQEVGGQRRSVPAAYWTAGREYGFRLGANDPALPVTIDPLLQATYLGGSLNDYAFAVAVHPQTHDIYVTGRTESPNFPRTAGGPQPLYAGRYDDAFIARFNSTLRVLEQTTYLGGSGIDIGFAIAVHPTTGEVFVAGQAGSANLPGTDGGAQPRYAGNTDAFVARLDSTLTRLNQVTYLGGTWGDSVESLAIHPTTGEVFVAGWTISPDFPRSAGGAQEQRSSDEGFDAFVARLDPGLTLLNQATYIGGSRTDEATDIAIDAARDEIVVCGPTESPDFPGTAGGAQSGYRGDKDGFVTRLSASLNRLIQSTYLGGSGLEWAIAVAIDPADGDVFVGGDSTSTDLPGTSENARNAFGGWWDGFIAKLSSNLTVLKRARHFGGAGLEFITALTIHPSTGEIFVVGQTTSTDLPGTAGGSQPSYGGGVLDAFVARFSSDLGGVNQATYLGGRDRETAWALVIDATTGEVIVAGDTRSEDFPAIAGGGQPSYGGGDEYGGDAFVARFAGDRASSPALAPAPTRSPSRPRLVGFR